MNGRVWKQDSGNTSFVRVRNGNAILSYLSCAIVSDRIYRSNLLPTFRRKLSSFLSQPIDRWHGPTQRETKTVSLSRCPIFLFTRNNSPRKGIADEQLIKGDEWRVRRWRDNGVEDRGPDRGDRSGRSPVGEPSAFAGWKASLDRWKDAGEAEWWRHGRCGQVVRKDAAGRSPVHPFPPLPRSCFTLSFLSLSFSLPRSPRRLASPLVLLSGTAPSTSLLHLFLPRFLFLFSFHKTGVSRSLSLLLESIGEVHRAVCLPSCLLGRAQAQA